MTPIDPQPKLETAFRTRPEQLFRSEAAPGDSRRTRGRHAKVFFVQRDDMVKDFVAAASIHLLSVPFCHGACQ
jgi:hypothetical protein